MQRMTTLQCVCLWSLVSIASSVHAHGIFCIHPTARISAAAVQSTRQSALGRRCFVCILSTCISCSDIHRTTRVIPRVCKQLTTVASQLNILKNEPGWPHCVSCFEYSLRAHSSISSYDLVMMLRLTLISFSHDVGQNQYALDI